MLLKYFYDTSLAHASYMVGCQKTGDAIIIDPGRDIDGYIEAAGNEGMKITGAADTHIHADYVSGARQLAVQLGAKLYLSDEGPLEWKYHYANQHSHQLLKQGDSFYVGKVKFEVLHTPGHTPESISYVLTDEGGGARSPMGVFTGDFVFVGSIGRPDLLEEAAGLVGTAEAGAKDLFCSIQKFRQLDDHLQIWPAHGAGSACGKGLGSIPCTTVGYEKLYNPALQIPNECEFVDYILAEQPEAPTYFARMKQVNKLGPSILDIDSLIAELSVDELIPTAQIGQVIDTRIASSFARGHTPGTINLPMKYLAAWAGWFVEYEKPLYLLASSEDKDEAVRILQKIGVENIAGWFDCERAQSAGIFTGSYLEITAEQLFDKVTKNEVVLVDVRGLTEWQEQRIESAQHHFLAHLPRKLAAFSGDCSVVFQCRSGGRSAIAASLAKAAGVKDVANLLGGIHAWQDAGFPVTDYVDYHGPGDDASIIEGACQGQAVFWETVKS